MSKITRRATTGVTEDVFMVALCSVTSFWLLASANMFDLDTTSGLLTFLLTDLILSVLLSTIGVALNHMVARNVRVTLRRRR
jgi:uncharacterized BrkB/YihY/UPF0761 family membrane protein